MVAMCIVTVTYANNDVKVVFKMKDRLDVEKTYTLQQLSDDEYRLIIPKAELGNKVDMVEVFAPFATANKGDDGFWLLHRGIYGTFRHDDSHWCYEPYESILPYYAMKTPKGSFIGIVEKMRWEFQPIVTAREGKYVMFLRFDIARVGKAYEDISVLYKKFPATSDYNDFAQYYRQWKLSTTPELKTLREKSKEIPTLEKMVESIIIRIGHAVKLRPTHERKNYTPETEYPVTAYDPFLDTLKTMKVLKAEGLNNLQITSTCWATGGSDGRCPSIFPICVEAGGEEDYKKFVAGTKELGYLIGGHINWTDALTCSPDWSLDIVCKRVNGDLARTGCYWGGLGWAVCLKHLSKTLLPKDIPHLGELGFNGTAYVDVFSAIRPYDCFDPEHPITAKEAGDIQRKIAQQLSKTCGGFSSEAGFDHLAAETCYISYVSLLMHRYRKNFPKGVDGFVPFWELVYHGYILSNPDRHTQSRDDVKVDDKTKAWLLLVEYGGRPAIYSVMAKETNRINAIKDAYKRYQPLKHLRWERMVSHKKLAEGVFETAYENGQRTIVNYNKTPFKMGDIVVKPRDYMLLKK